MSGHSKWANIKHQKGAADAKRGTMFTKLTREIMIAVKESGSNPEGNFRLRLAIQKARDFNMPLDNIDRAIKKGSGELGGGGLAEVTLEGFGPNGTAILVQALSIVSSHLNKDLEYETEILELNSQKSQCKIKCRLIPKEETATRRAKEVKVAANHLRDELQKRYTPKNPLSIRVQLPKNHE